MMLKSKHNKLIGMTIFSLIVIGSGFLLWQKLVLNQDTKATMPQASEGCFSSVAQADETVYSPIGMIVYKSSPIRFSSLTLEDRLQLASNWGQHYAANHDLAQQLAVRLNIMESQQTMPLELIEPLDKLWNQMHQGAIEQSVIDAYIEKNRSQFPSDMSQQTIEQSIRHYLTLKDLSNFDQLRRRALIKEEHLAPLPVMTNCPPLLTKTDRQLMQIGHKNSNQNELIFIASPFCTQCREQVSEIFKYKNNQKKSLQFQTIPLFSKQQIDANAIHQCLTKGPQSNLSDQFNHIIYTLPLNAHTWKRQKILEYIQDKALAMQIPKDAVASCYDAFPDKTLQQKMNTLTELIFEKNMQPIIIINNRILVRAIKTSEVYTFLKANLEVP